MCASTATDHWFNQMHDERMSLCGCLMWLVFYNCPRSNWRSWSHTSQHWTRSARRLRLCCRQTLMLRPLTPSPSSTRVTRPSSLLPRWAFLMTQTSDCFISRWDSVGLGAAGSFFRFAQICLKGGRFVFDRFECFDSYSWTVCSQMGFSLQIEYLPSILLFFPKLFEWSLFIGCHAVCTVCGCFWKVTFGHKPTCSFSSSPLIHSRCIGRPWLAFWGVAEGKKKTAGRPAGEEKKWGPMCMQCYKDQREETAQQVGRDSWCWSARK